MAGFGSLLAMTASLYARYKLCVSSIHRQWEAAPKHQATEAPVSRSQAWMQAAGPEWLIIPKVTKDWGRGYKRMTMEKIPPPSLSPGNIPASVFPLENGY